MGKGAGGCDDRPSLGLAAGIAAETINDWSPAVIRQFSLQAAKQLIPGAAKDPNCSHHSFYLLQRQAGYRGFHMRDEDYHPQIKERLNGHHDLYDFHTLRDDLGNPIRDDAGAPRMTPEREALHAGIVAAAMSPNRKRERKLTAILGAPGSGKSSTESSLGLDDYTKVNPDLLLAELPDFPVLQSIGDPALSQVVYREKKALQQALVDALLADGANMALDVTGNQGEGVFRGQLEQFIAQGYQVDLYYVACEPHEAFRRMMGRGRSVDGRYMTGEVMDDSHRSVPTRLFGEIQHMESINSITIVDNNGSEARTVGTKSHGGEWKPIDGEAIDQFAAFAGREAPIEFYGVPLYEES